MPDFICPICGDELVDWPAPRAVGGWRVCGHHKIVVMPSKFDSRCHSCLGQIASGDLCLLCRHGKSWVVLHPREHCEALVAVEASGPYAQLHLTDDAPWPVVVAAYKALATIHHPDHGGALERMKTINAALDVIRAGRETA